MNSSYSAKDRFSYNAIFIILVVKILLMISPFSNKVIIYPNPFNNQIHIFGEGITNIKVYNAYGRLVSHEIKASLINPINWEKGIYIFQITDHKNTYSYKLIKS